MQSKCPAMPAMPATLPRMKFAVEPTPAESGEHRTEETSVAIGRTEVDVKEDAELVDVE